MSFTLLQSALDHFTKSKGKKRGEVGKINYEKDHESSNFTFLTLNETQTFHINIFLLCHGAWVRKKLSFSRFQDLFKVN